MVISNTHIKFTTPEHFNPYNENHSHSITVGWKRWRTSTGLFKVQFQLRDFGSQGILKKKINSKLDFDFQITGMTT